MSRKRASKKKTKGKTRRASVPSAAGKGHGRPSAAAPPVSGGVLPALVQAKLELLRLVRALDAAGVDPREHPGLPDEVVACARLDELLTKTVEIYDRESVGGDRSVPEEIRQLLATSAAAVGRVFALFPRRLAKRVRRELGRVGVAEPEIWLEVEGLRAFGSGDLEDPMGDRVTGQDAKELPCAFEASAWLESLPVAWLRTIARMHRVDPKGKKASLVARIEEALLDPETLSTVLAEGLGHRERMRLAEFAITVRKPVLLAELPEAMRRGLEVPWDWSLGLPSGTGGRLRGYGLLYVGTVGGEPAAAVPPELCAPIVTALKRADPKGWRSVDPLQRRALEIIEREGLDDAEEEEESGADLDLGVEDRAGNADVRPELLRWRERAHRVLDVLADSFANKPPPEDATDRLFGPIQAVRPIREQDIEYLLLLVLYDWRSGPRSGTPAESLLTRPRGLGKKEIAILASLCKERTGLYRIESILDGEGAEVVDAFTGGPKRKVDAPELGLVFEVGDLIPARLFQAGPYCLFNMVAEPVNASRAGEAVAWLEESFRGYAKERGTLDREAFLRLRPEYVPLASLRMVDLEWTGNEEAVGNRSASSRAPTKPPAKRKKPEKIYVLDVDLVEAFPPVTRRVRVSGRRTLEELHHILQRVMGWDDSHVHVFEAPSGSWRYADPDHDLEQTRDETKVTLDEVATRRGSRFFYLYDLGDHWIHEIRVAERLDPKNAGPEPWCVGGQNACPPEDSGGVGGYAWRLAAKGDPDHPEHEEAKMWMGDDFDPAHFDLEDVNRHFQAEGDS